MFSFLSYPSASLLLCVSGIRFSLFAHSAASSPASAVQWRKCTKRQFTRLLLPRLCQFSGASRACCRMLWRKWRNMVARPVLVAVHDGSNFRHCANFNAVCNVKLGNKKGAEKSAPKQLFALL